MKNPFVIVIGDEVVFTGGVIVGLRGKVIAKSPRTGGLTIVMLEERSSWQVGDKVNCMPYEVKNARLIDATGVDK